MDYCALIYRYELYTNKIVMRFYYCSGFIHMADRCIKPPVCLKCGSRTHNAQYCNGEEEKLCPNCEELNTKFGLNLDIRYSVFDRN